MDRPKIQLSEAEHEIMVLQCLLVRALFKAELSLPDGPQRLAAHHETIEAIDELCDYLFVLGLDPDEQDIIVEGMFKMARADLNGTDPVAAAAPKVTA